MRIRKLLLATGAIVAAGTLALAPTASANTPTGTVIDNIVVNGGGDDDITLTMKSASVNIRVYGIPLNINCTAGSASGYVNEGAFAVPNPGVGMVIDTMSLTCPSIFPGTTVAMTATCPIDVKFADSNVHTGLTDTGTGTKFSRVDGLASAGAGFDFNNCVTVSISNGCTFTIRGTSDAFFDEAVKPNGTQDLVLSGNNSVIVESPSGCMGAVSDNQTFTLNAVFNVDVDGSAATIDFQ